MKRILLATGMALLMMLPSPAQKPVRVTYKTIVNGREVQGDSRTFIESDGDRKSVV